MGATLTKEQLSSRHSNPPTLQHSITPPSWPSVAFVIPVLNAARDLPACLATLRDQDYPADRFEIIVVDGGSTDDTVALARSFGARVIPNPLKLAEPGVDLGFKAAAADIVVAMAADNGLPRADWLRLMMRPFMERPAVIGTFTQIVPHPSDNSFTKYYCRLHVEPFTWFVYGPAANPREFHKAYKVVHDGDEYRVFRFTPLGHPLIAMAQAFAVRRDFKRREGFEHDDILPIIQMIEDGRELAYVPDAGVYHHHLLSFGHYLRKYQWRIANSLEQTQAGFDRRAPYLTRWRRLKKYLFVLYGLTVVGPLFDSLRLVLREKAACMLWHGPASVGLSWLIFGEWLKAKCRRIIKGVVA